MHSDLTLHLAHLRVEELTRDAARRAPRRQRSHRARWRRHGIEATTAGPVPAALVAVPPPRWDDDVDVDIRRVA